MHMTCFEIIVRPSGFRITAKVNGKPATLALVETAEQADAFVAKCQAYNNGVYDNEVFEALNAIRMP